MDKYIKVDSLISECNNTKIWETEWNENPSLAIRVLKSQGNTFRRIIDELPTADVREVVRCKDCIYLNNKYAKLGETDENGNPNYYCNRTGKRTGIGDYCSCAEKKEVK